MTAARTVRGACWGLVLAGLLTLLLAPLARAADPVPITTGAGADWGVKTSFRNYIVGPIAHGAIELGDGATRNADGTFHWPIAGGEYDPDTRSVVVRFGGSVHFSGHDGELNMRVWNPRVEITPDGADLYAEVISKPNSPDAPTKAFPNTRLARLDPAGIEPDVAGGTTTWPALPATLTPDGVEPFAGFYGADTVLDAVRFSYAGPGGTPVAESWTPAGTDTLGALASGRVRAGVGLLALGWDGRLWSSSYDGRTLATSDGSSLAPLRTVDVGVNPRNVAIDRTRRAAYAVDTGIVRVTDQGGELVRDTTPVASFAGAGNALAVRQSDGALFTVWGGELHRYLDGAHDSWSFPDFSFGYFPAIVIGANDRLYVAGAGIAEVRFGADGGASATTIAASATNVAVAPDGTLAWLELTGAAPNAVMTLRVMRVRADGGYVTPVDTPAPTLGAGAMAFSGDGERLFITDNTNTRVQVVEDGAVVRTVQAGDSDFVNAIVAGPGGTAYASWRDGTVKRIGPARSPAPTTQPQDTAVELAAAGDSAELRLTAAASGSPAPAISWQQRTSGSSRWVTIDGATSETLTVTANEALSGTRYRAIFANAGGSIASDVATVTVTVRAPVVDPGPGGGGGGGGGVVTPPPGDSGPVKVDAPVPPAPVAVAPRLTTPKGPLALDRSRRATVATVVCAKGGAACRLTAPKRVVVKIGGKRFTATVTAPKSVAAGKRGAVRLQLTKAAAARLAGTRVTVSVKLTVTSGGKQVTRTLKVTLRGAKVKKAAR
ncbi:HtaA domain-containing protein [Conexibacter sp. JD483]|uniref:HtaA domain-containing protein n=1 Tax=unclassified Conexibacter TaxID=2627773 RepID=UPI0027278A67|nr:MULTISPECIES: HtaA domain-containing protein [unclassified Conexibacter]MDO8185682.1 HtaA domain-containing protein [Conexibacter sp. CPCC 205706]MDO8198855.1 HtaA domain-containing protein [Conexibacter sp. CPCC 205762]MDR9372088.1 HtaA domain-containing protein [Conexibacter sp. JD483]